MTNFTGMSRSNSILRRCLICITSGAFLALPSWGQDNDAAVTSITNIPDLVCGTDVIAPVITLKNNSDTTMYSMILEYGVTGEPSVLGAWNGELLPGETVNHALPELVVLPGEKVLTVTCSSPNGMQDSIPENDQWSRAFTVNQPAEFVELHLVLDAFGSDVTWDLRMQSGTLLYSGGPYEDEPQGETVVVPFCLTNGCYTFTINDLFDDGICCTNGQGNYRLLSTSGTLYGESDGQYGEQDVQEFCLVNVSVEEPVDRANLEAFPNPTSGRLTIRTNIQGPSVLDLNDALGRHVLRIHMNDAGGMIDLDLGALPDGLYLLSSAGGAPVQRIMVQH